MIIPAAMSVASSLLGGGKKDQSQTTETTYNYDPKAKSLNERGYKYANRVIRPEVESYYQKYREGMTPEAQNWWQRMSDIYKGGGPESLQQAHKATMNQAQQLSANPMMFFNDPKWSELLQSNRNMQGMQGNLQARELEGELGNQVNALGMGNRAMAEGALQGQATREASYQNLLAQYLNAQSEAQRYGFEQLPKAWSSAEAFDPEGYSRAAQQLGWQNLPMEAQGDVLNQYINQILQGFLGPTFQGAVNLFSHPDSITQTTNTEGGDSGGLMGGLSSLLGQGAQGASAGIMSKLLGK